MESEKLIIAKSLLGKDNQNTKKRTIDECSQPESPALSSENIDLSACPVKVVIETKSHNIYCLDTSNGLKALKTTNENNPTIQNNNNLDNELKIGSEMSFHAFRKSYAMTSYQNKKALILEWANGEPLSDIQKLPIPCFLKVAREIVSCLLAMHCNKICHLNLTCDHIILDEESETVKIIGCGSSSSFSNKQSHGPKLLEKDLRYISPEQSGRVNRDVDYRSDFYSLGVVFYRILAGFHPFESSNEMKIVRMILFQNPLPLYEVDPSIPLPISSMVSKLMEKDVDSRYKSAKGIMHDIDLIISDYKPGAEIILAQHDTPETVLLPQKLYGRSNEYASLLSAYDRSVSLSSCEVVFVKGKSGSGKTAFVKELNKHVTKDGKVFIHGKYDFSRSEPYSGFIEAVNMFCDVVELEDETTLANYRSMIQDAVGEEGKLLTNVVDRLHSIIGKQSETFESFGAEAKNRFNYVFIKFIKAIASVSCPLVICLDDLQWIDLASLDLLKALVDGPVKNLLLIGNYRHDEIQDGHKLVNFMETARMKNIIITEIMINNMDHESINEFLIDALYASPFDLYPLTAFIHDRTKGNIFFVKQVLIDLLEKELITYDYEKGKWVWDLSIFEGINISENVRDILTQKIKSLDVYGQQALVIASCLGTFSLSALRLIISSKKGVEDALATGMITQCKGSDKGCFAHDQVKHAAQSLLPENPKRIYLHVARKLWKLLPKEDLEENIYTIVNLFNQTKDIMDMEDQHDVAKLFLLAGDKAMESAAPAEAYEYFKSAIELSNEADWKTHYEFSITVYCNAAKSSYWLKNYKFMSKCIEQICKNAISALDLVTPYLLQIRMHNDKRMFSEALANASIILDMLGQSIDLHQTITPSKILHTKNLVGESIESILELREMNDTTLLSAMEIMNTISYSSFSSGNHQVFASLALKMVQLTIQWGICKYSSPAFCCFAIVLHAIGDKSSDDFGKLSLKLLEKFKAKEMLPMVNMGYFTLVCPFYTHLRKTLAPLGTAIIISAQIGSHHYTASIIAGYIFQSFLCGESLSKLLDELSQFEELHIAKTKLYSSVYQAILNLHVTNIENPAKLSGEKFDCKYCFDMDGVKFDIAQTSLISAHIAYLFYDYDTALQLLDICRPLIHCYKVVMQSIFYFYDGLIISAMARDTKSEHIDAVEKDISKLKQFAKNSPENYHNKMILLHAELALLYKNHSEAKSYYQEAISFSNKYGFINDESLSCERYAILCLELKEQQDAKKMLLQSYTCYKMWGACSKMNHLVQTYQLLKDTLKDSANALDKCSKILNDSNAVETVSMLSNLSSTSINTWQEQKRSRLSINK